MLTAARVFTYLLTYVNGKRKVFFRAT